MTKTSMKFKVTFTQEVLGMASGNRDIQEEFIASKAPTVEAAQEEVESIAQVQENIQKASTVFQRDKDGFVHVFDYHIRGMMKEQILALIELGDITTIGKWSYKRAVDSFLFVNPRRIYMLNEKGQKISGALENLQRPLRATTMQGDRICLARSEMLPIGTNYTFDVVILQGGQDGPPVLDAKGNPKKKSKVAAITPEIVRACMEMAGMKGSFQWRGGGWGRFSHEEIK